MQCSSNTFSECIKVTWNYANESQTLVFIANGSLMIFSGRVSLISPNSPNFSWDVLALDGDNIIASTCECVFIRHEGLSA